MISLRTGVPTLDRFAAELEAQAPRRLVLAPQLDGARAEDVNAAWLGWAQRIVDEHRSVLVFTELLGLLGGLGAPFPALAAVQRLIGDELRHVRLCAELASAFGPLERLSIDLDDLGLPPRGEQSPGTRALLIVVRELIVGEGESLAILRAYRDAATDPSCRAALSLILTDEARHHAVGRHLLPLLLRTLSESDLRAAGDLDALALADARALRTDHRAGARNGPGRAFGVSIRADEAPPALAAPLAA